jgi:hypothetical protein
MIFLLSVAAAAVGSFGPDRTGPNRLFAASECGEFSGSICTSSTTCYYVYFRLLHKKCETSYTYYSNGIGSPESPESQDEG